MKRLEVDSDRWANPFVHSKIECVKSLIQIPSEPLCQTSVKESNRNTLALRRTRGHFMITCVVNYEIDPTKIEIFEKFASAWIYLVTEHGGTHHGYFLPSEGASDKALALFSFDGLASYERFRSLFGVDARFIKVDRIRDESGCVIRHERTFMRPFFASDITGIEGEV